jgi:Holliday junction DNA helicase RuvB
MATDELRPRDWSSFIGQKKLKRRLQVHIRAAVAEGRTLDHILLTGPPGFGKTTLSQLIADEMTNAFRSLTMPVNKRHLDFILRTHTGVVLLDELHRAAKATQEDLLPVLEFGHLLSRSGMTYDVSDVTIIGATTEPEKIIPPLYDRFVIKPDFEDYSDTEMAEIVQSMADQASVSLRRGMAKELGRAAGGTPRNARQLVLATRDLTVTLDKTPTPNQVLTLCGVGPDGLTDGHMRYLGALEQLGGQAGLKTVGNMLRLNEVVLRDLERLLVNKRLLTYTDRGREMTGDGYARLNTKDRK